MAVELAVHRCRHHRVAVAEDEHAVPTEVQVAPAVDPWPVASAPIVAGGHTPGTAQLAATLRRVWQPEPPLPLAQWETRMTAMPAS